MLDGNFRPWGNMQWLHHKLNITEWSLLGCASTEERCCSAIYHLEHNLFRDAVYFLNIGDTNDKYTAERTRKTNTNISEINKLTSGNAIYIDHNLMDSAPKISKSITQFISESNGNVVLDITALPKRFFFLITKWLLNDEQIDNLVITYSKPGSYVDEALAEEPLPWSHLPSFQSDLHPLPEVRNAVIGVGFLPFGLPDLIKSDYADVEVNLLFPFPPGPPNYQRTWEFVREIERSYPLSGDNYIHRIDAMDTAGCFQKITELTIGTPSQTVLAPYGPKPHSLAMCLFACAHDCEVFYTQPQVYHPDYSMGMAVENGMPVTLGYVVKLDGKNLYSDNF